MQTEDVVVWPGGSRRDLGREGTSVKTIVNRNSALIRTQSQGLLAFAKIPEICRDSKQHRVSLSLDTQLSTFHTLPNWYWHYLPSSPLYIDKDPKLREIT